VPARHISRPLRHDRPEPLPQGPSQPLPGRWPGQMPFSASTTSTSTPTLGTGITEARDPLLRETHDAAEHSIRIAFAAPK
jgi:hypothetical protein